MPRLFTSSRYTSLRRKLRRQSTRAEVVLWNYLQNRRLMGLKFRRQHSIGRYVTDFFCAEKMLVVEVDGDTHLDPEQLQYDRERQAWIESHGIHVVRFTDGQVFEEINQVLDELRRLLSSHPSSPRRAQPL